MLTVFELTATGVIVNKHFLNVTVGNVKEQVWLSADRIIINMNKVINDKIINKNEQQGTGGSSLSGSLVCSNAQITVIHGHCG